MSGKCYYCVTCNCSGSRGEEIEELKNQISELKEQNEKLKKQNTELREWVNRKTVADAYRREKPTTLHNI